MWLSRRARLLSALALITTCLAAVLAFPEETASAYPYPDINLVGHGWGHGMGMGQWGALGYALDGQIYQQILTDYYGKLADDQTTSIGKLAGSGDSTIVRVAMTEEDGLDPVITSQSAFTVDGVPFLARQSARFVPTSDDTSWDVERASSGGCSASSWSVAKANVANPIAVPSVTETFPVDADLADQVLELCEGADAEGLRGNIEETFYSKQSRTVNFVPLEPYVADVTPSESPAYWGTIGTAGSQGQHQGFQELEAQAVAARSYVMSDLGGWGGYADTCDLDCESYPGITNENALASLAVTDTQGVVVHLPGGQVATTQYSSSTGGWTVASTFAATPDAGDSVCVPDACNPHHTWYASVPVSAVEAAFPSIGTLESVQVTQRDGNGYFGGRVLQMTLEGSHGTVNMTGSDFATDFASYGVQSYWFDVTNEASGGIGGYWLAASDGGIFSFGNAQYHGSMGGRRLNEPIVGIAATSDHDGYWLVASDGGIFSFGDAKFHGSMGGRRLNEPIVGMAATPDGGGYWLVASDGGIFSFGDAKFHGSMGGRHLNKPIVGIATTPDGGGYWLVASDGGIFSFGDAKFWGSTGNLTLNKPIEGMARDVVGTGYWLVAQDGGIFSFGTAQYQGSLPGLDIVDDSADAMLATTTDGGYLIVCSDGKAYAVGDAPQLGDVQSAVPGYDGKVVGAASLPG